jgi:hypothetical protein
LREELEHFGGRAPGEHHDLEGADHFLEHHLRLAALVGRGHEARPRRRRIRNRYIVGVLERPSGRPKWDRRAADLDEQRLGADRDLGDRRERDHPREALGLAFILDADVDLDLIAVLDEEDVLTGLIDGHRVAAVAERPAAGLGAARCERQQTQDGATRHDDIE